jgi:hypothetical protein
MAATPALAASSVGASYFVTLIVFFTVLPPAFFEDTLKVTLTLPGLFAFSLTPTVTVFRAPILPTDPPWRRRAALPEG